MGVCCALPACRSARDGAAEPVWMPTLSYVGAAFHNPSGKEFSTLTRAFKIIVGGRRLTLEADPLPLQAHRSERFLRRAPCSPTPPNPIFGSVCVARTRHVCGSPARHLRLAKQGPHLAPSRGVCAARRPALFPSPLSMFQHFMRPSISAPRGSERDAAPRLPFLPQASDAPNLRSPRRPPVCPILLARLSVGHGGLLAGRAMAGGAPTSGHALPAPAGVGLPHVGSRCPSGRRPSAPLWAAPGRPPPPPPPRVRLRPETDHISRLAQRFEGIGARRVRAPAHDVSPCLWVLTLVRLGDVGRPGGCVRGLRGYGDASKRLSRLWLPAPRGRVWRLDTHFFAPSPPLLPCAAVLTCAACLFKWDGETPHLHSRPASPY